MGFFTVKDKQGCTLVMSPPVSLVSQAPVRTLPSCGVLLCFLRDSAQVEGVLCLSVTIPAAGSVPREGSLMDFNLITPSTNVLGLHRASGRKS